MRYPLHSSVFVVTKLIALVTFVSAVVFAYHVFKVVTGVQDLPFKPFVITGLLLFALVAFWVSLSYTKAFMNKKEFGVMLDEEGYLTVVSPLSMTETEHCSKLKIRNSRIALFGISWITVTDNGYEEPVKVTVWLRTDVKRILIRDLKRYQGTGTRKQNVKTTKNERKRKVV